MGRNQTVLIVDDDPTQIAILSAYFASMLMGPVLHAKDGQEALEILKQNTVKIDLIITDLNMPNIDGYELIRHLKELNYSGNFSLISSHDDLLRENAANLAKMYGLQFIGHIKKPLTKGALDHVFLTDKNEFSETKKRSTQEVSPSEIQTALDASEFVPFFQPKIDMLSGEVIGAEALARWKHPDRGMISPVNFIPLAEKHGLIDRITMQLLDKIMANFIEYGSKWSDIKIAMNLPPSMLADVNLPDILQKRLKAAGVPNTCFCFEITESGILDFDPHTVEVLSRLRMAGFDLAIDDFGTGAANISNLRMFPYSELKIDQSFINNILTDAFSEETVRASISLARQLGMRIVAEGIENREVFDHIKAKGIDQAQGYYIAKPQTAEDATLFFDSRHSWLTGAQAIKQNAA